MINIIKASRLRGKAEQEANTFIGGIGDNITTDSQLASLLSIPLDTIRNFNISNNDISCFITNSYALGNAFANTNFPISFFIDLQGKVTSTGSAFRQDNQSFDRLRFVYLPNAQVGDEAFRNRGFFNRLTIAIQNSVPVGSTTENDFTFNNSQNQGQGAINFEVYCDIINQTNNNGNPDGDIQLLLNQGSDVFYRDSNNTNQTTTPTMPTISVNTIGGTFVELNISQPTHVNTLKYALVFVDGFFQDVYDIDNVFALNLQEQTSYNIKVIIADEYFNISPYSNTINVTTTTTPALFQNAFAYYKLNETSGNAIDLVNGHNGTLNGGVTQGVAGKIGTAYSFDGSSGFINFGNNASSEFSDGAGNDIPFTIRMWINPNTIDNQWLFSKDGSGDRELIYRINTGGVVDVLFINGTTSNPFINTTFNAGIVTGQFQHIVLTYDGSKSSDGIKLYVDNVEKLQTTSTQTFGGFVNGNEPLSFGYQARTSGNYYDGIVDEQTIIKNEVWDITKISDDYNNGIGTTI